MAKQELRAERIMIGKIASVYQSYFLFTPRRIVSDELVDELVATIRLSGEHNVKLSAES